MSPKRDNTETMARNFMDDDSYVGLDGHEYLYGDDVAPRRRQVFNRSRGWCEVQTSPRCQRIVGWVDGEMHHRTPGLMGAKRPDDLELLAWSCIACHQQEHGDREPQFQKKAQAAKDFDALHPEAGNEHSGNS